MNAPLAVKKPTKAAALIIAGGIANVLEGGRTAYDAYTMHSLIIVSFLRGSILLNSWQVSAWDIFITFAMTYTGIWLVISGIKTNNTNPNKIKVWSLEALSGSYFCIACAVLSGAFLLLIGFLLALAGSVIGIKYKG